MTVSEWEIPALRADRLGTLLPFSVYAGGAIASPGDTLFLWRTYRFSTSAKGGMLSFYTDDYRFECLWNRPTYYAERFASFGWGAIVEPDYSVWCDAPLIEQVWAIYRMRSLGRLYQEHGLNIIPNLIWGNARSFLFAFEGIPVGAPVCMTECRTPGSNDSDRRAFLKGLTEGVKQIQPGHVCIYGGQEHSYWLAGNLPSGPEYTLLESWTSARGKIRATEARRAKEKNQYQLFGGEKWVDADRADRVVAA